MKRIIALLAIIACCCQANAGYVRITNSIPHNIRIRYCIVHEMTTPEFATPFPNIMPGWFLAPGTNLYQSSPAGLASLCGWSYPFTAATHYLRMIEIDVAGLGVFVLDSGGASFPVGTYTAYYTVSGPDNDVDILII